MARVYYENMTKAWGDGLYLGQVLAKCKPDARQTYAPHDEKRDP